MEGHKRFALIGLELSGDVAVQLLQLCGVGGRIAPVAVSAAGIGLDQAIADGFHLLHRPQRIQPDVGIHSTVIMARRRAVVFCFHRDDAAAGIDHLQLGIACGGHELVEEPLHLQAVLHQHPCLAQGGQVARPGLEIVGPCVGRDEGGHRGAVAGHGAGEQGDRQEGGDHFESLVSCCIRGVLAGRAAGRQHQAHDHRPAQLRQGLEPSERTHQQPCCDNDSHSI